MVDLIRFMTAGESHGKGLVGIIDGVPAGLDIDERYINAQLGRRQAGYGRGARMRSLKDQAEILSGIHHGKTTGSPVALLIWNGSENQWFHESGSSGKLPAKKITVPRPGHADLTGYIKYGFDDMLPVMERASARETAMRVALGSIARKFLETVKVSMISHVVRIGKAVLPESQHAQVMKMNIRNISALAEASPVRCTDKQTGKEMIRAIGLAEKQGDSLGGIFEVLADGLIPGLGSYTAWDKRINAGLARYITSIPGIKGVEFGGGFNAAGQYGSGVQDEIYCDKKRFIRKTNQAGGIEGGMTNGERLIIRAAMKPIPTLSRPLKSVDVKTKKPSVTPVYRADVCAVPAAGIVAEAMAALCLMDVYLEKFGGDSMREIIQRFKQHQKL